MLYPYPYPLQGIFTELTEAPGAVRNVLQTHRSWGRVTEVSGPTEARVGSVMLYPVPVPAPGYFYRTDRSSGYGLKGGTELTEARVGLQKCYRTHRSLGRIRNALPRARNRSRVFLQNSQKLRLRFERG